MAKAKKTSGRTRSEAQKATEKNLIPNDKRSPEEVRKNGEKGGKKSGQVRKQQRNLRQAFSTIMAMKPKEKDRNEIAAALGISPDEIKDNTDVMAISLFGQVRAGNVKAIALANQITDSGMTDAEKKDYELKQQELQIKLDQHQIEMEEYQAKKNAKQAQEYRGIPALSFAWPFAKVYQDINEHGHIEYCLRGGRGSGKSSFVSLAIIDLMMKHPNLNALVLRQVSNTIAGSVFNQLVWAINELGLQDDFKVKKSPAEITRIGTGQVIFFRGADDVGKIKSIKPQIGYIGILWFEELDQFNGPESVRNIQQSAMRGGDDAWIFKSFNPPRSVINWANEYVMTPSENRYDSISSYLDVPRSWLGKDWIAEAEEMKVKNPAAYDNEYLGKANGTGGMVFDNVTVRKITANERAEFDRIYEGVDWGWYPDPFHFSRMYYNAAEMRLFIYGELRANKMSNEETAHAVREKFDIRDSKGKWIQSVDDGIIYCDSAEPKSVADWKSYGMPARGVVKGPDSVRYSMKWLQSLAEIVIDPNDCPETAKEFTKYEYERDKDGKVIEGYPDANNHAIDSVRYAMFPVWKHRGQ